MIRQGRVSLDGKVATLGDRIDPSRVVVTVDGVPIPADPDLRYLVLNKPPGVTTTLRDPHAERTVASLIPPGPRVYPVGRLDRESEGVLLLMNDGELAYRLQHPRYGVEKEYLVEVEGPVPKSVGRRLTTGVELDNGEARAVRAGPTHRGRGSSAISVVMLEGRKREVRRMFQSLGLRVKRLVRVRHGVVRLGKLRPGESRDLGDDEIRDLYRVTGLGRAKVGARRAESRSHGARKGHSGR